MFDVCSPDLEEDASTVAVIGAPRKSSNRITSEDIRWNAWLNSYPKATIQQPSEVDQERQPSRLISPGVSIYWNASDVSNPGSQEDLKGLSTCRVSKSPSRSGDLHSYGPPRESLNTEFELPEVHTKAMISNISRPTSSSELSKNPSYERSESSIKLRRDLVLPVETHLPVAPNVQDLLGLLTANEERQGTDPKLQDHQEATPDTEDEDETWRRFIFDGNGAEINRKARDEAHQQTKCDLGLKKSGVLSNFVESSLTSGSTALASDIAEPSLASRDRSSTTTERTPNMSDDSTENLPDAGLVVSSSEAAVASNMTDTADSIIAQQASPLQKPEFRFHQPQLFTGRLASDVPSIASSAPFHAPRKKNRQPRRRRDKGRPDFRAMPNYDDDPIEED
ncbi:hypothetical protein F66182_4928 [Fusarium sp. NRRL 66182]|nr:hypothetical protein F66182_4928 [Fusarium sp. NRRL 66182]